MHLPAFFALAALLLLGACSNPSSADQALKAINSSAGTASTPTPSSSPSAGAVEVQPSPTDAATVTGPAVSAGKPPATSRRVAPRSQTSTAGNSYEAGLSRDEDSEERAEDLAPVGGGADSGVGQSVAGGGSGSDGGDRTAGRDGGSSVGRGDHSRSADDGDRGDDGDDEEDEDD